MSTTATMRRMRALRITALDAAVPSGCKHVMSAPRIAVVGLGYVGLPLAVALARKFDVVGFDVDGGRIAELRDGRDRTREVEEGELRRTSLKLSDRPDECAGADVYIV